MPDATPLMIVFRRWSRLEARVDGATTPFAARDIVSRQHASFAGPDPGSDRCRVLPSPPFIPGRLTSRLFDRPLQEEDSTGLLSVPHQRRVGTNLCPRAIHHPARQSRRRGGYHRRTFLPAISNSAFLGFSSRGDFCGRSRIIMQERRSAGGFK